jgi:hypothetical protein
MRLTPKIRHVRLKTRVFRTGTAVYSDSDGRLLPHPIKAKAEIDVAGEGSKNMIYVKQ